MDKRAFLKKMSLLGVGTPVAFPHLDLLIGGVENVPIKAIAKDENFWAEILQVLGLPTEGLRDAIVRYLPR